MWVSRSTSRSCRRGETPTLPKTLRRCHSTVRALRYRRVPISGFDRPCCTSRAMWASCVVSDPGRRCGSFADPLSSRKELSTSSLREGRSPYRRACAARGAVRHGLRLGDPSRRSHSAVEQVSVRRFDTQARGVQHPIDLSVVRLGRGPVTREGTTRASMPCAQAVEESRGRRLSTPGFFE